MKVLKPQKKNWRQFVGDSIEISNMAWMENPEGIELKLEKHHLHMGYLVLHIIVACQWNMSSIGHGTYNL